jgi:GTP diphosphokinase / guanosine-3',5'-bis(diphosphate) 3'-diphosphatase
MAVQTAAMEPERARNFAYARHHDQHTRSGALVVEHLERVAASVPDDARTVAFLHDVLERTATSTDELDALGLTLDELGALRLLARGPTESFEVHALRIAYARGPEGRLARTVKLADIEDHLAHDPVDGQAHPYTWARRHVATCQEREEAAQATGQRPRAIRPSALTASHGLSGIAAAGDAPG